MLCHGAVSIPVAVLQKFACSGAGEMVRQLREMAALLTETRVQFPAPVLGSSYPPVASGNLMPLLASAGTALTDKPKHAHFCVI